MFRREKVTDTRKSSQQHFWKVFSEEVGTLGEKIIISPTLRRCNLIISIFLPFIKRSPKLQIGIESKSGLRFNLCIIMLEKLIIVR